MFGEDRFNAFAPVDWRAPRPSHALGGRGGACRGALATMNRADLERAVWFLCVGFAFEGVIFGVVWG